MLTNKICPDDFQDIKKVMIMQNPFDIDLKF